MRMREYEVVVKLSGWNKERGLRSNREGDLQPPRAARLVAKGV